MLEFDIQLERPGFTLQANETLAASITGVIGASGAGKSTLLNLIAGLTPPASGRIVLNERVLFDRAARVNLRPHKRRIGMMFQDSRLLPHYTVRGNLGYGRRPAGRGGSAGRRGPDMLEVARLLEIDHLLHRRPRELSGGEKQRVALGRAVLSEPDLLLLDEPWSSLDRPLRERLLPMLAQIQRSSGTPMVVVSHSLSDVLRLTDRVMLLDRGRVVQHGDFWELLTDPAAAHVLHGHDPVNVTALTVHERVGSAGLAQLVRTEPSEGPAAPSMPPVRITAPVEDSVPVGAVVHAVIRPQDIALALAPVEQISMQNQIPGVVRRITRLPRLTLCHVDVGFELVAEITHRSQIDFSLTEGKRVWCLFKAQAVQVAPTGIDATPPPPGSTGGSEAFRRRSAAYEL